MPVFWNKNVSHVGLHPSFLANVISFLEFSPYNWYIIQAYRSLETQQVLYNTYLKNGKPKAAPPGKSAHNYGLAVDIVLDEDPNKPGLQPSWNTKLSAWIWLFLKLKFHPTLKSGVTFGDGDHIEYRNWEQFKNWNQ